MSRFNVYEKVAQLNILRDRIEKLRVSGEDDKKLHVLELMFKKHYKTEIPLLLINQNGSYFYYFPDIDDVIIQKEVLDGSLDLTKFVELEQANKIYSDEVARFDDAVNIVDNAIDSITTSKIINSWDDIKAYLAALYDFRLRNSNLDIQYLDLPTKNSSK